MADASGYRDRGLGDHRRHSNHKRTRGEDEDRLEDDVRRVKRRYDDHEKSSTRHRHPSDHHHRSHRHRRSSTPSTRTPNELPLGARSLVRSDLEVFKPLLAQYLEVQKCKDIAALDEREVKGRWKSFVGKWNRGELAEGWYDPDTLQEARKTYTGAGAGAQLVSEDKVTLGASPSRPSRGDGSMPSRSGEDEYDDEDDEYGPALPGSARDQSDATRSTRHGPGIPNRQDLDLRRENAEEERIQRIEDIRSARKADRTEQRTRLEELVPRAEPGTRERRLEKKREVNEKMRGFRDKSPGGGAEVGEAELMGGGDSVAEYKRMKAAADRRKTEREVRREEEARIREAEREERVREYRQKEEETMEVLKRIARERFGSGSGSG
ncbi:hypothetical protein F5Y11DRAFT_164034 [Daldinia sp. FL1419]|nr:hypothetical protein F5Y11DRAFT_164034 [Daldinia sp. FL1419]